MVIIKNFDMPDSCLRCGFCIRDTVYPSCILDKKIGKSFNISWENLDKRPEWCPLQNMMQSENGSSVIFDHYEVEVLAQELTDYMISVSYNASEWPDVNCASVIVDQIEEFIKNKVIQIDKEKQ